METGSYSMKLLLSCLCLILITSPGSCSLRNVDTFEFGTNIGELAFSTSGAIGLFEKIKRVSVRVPECTELKYVRVDINNTFGPPTVKFDWETHTVVIEFGPLQYSVSQYTITAKAIPTYCASSKVEKQFISVFPFSVD